MEPLFHFAPPLLNFKNGQMYQNCNQKPWVSGYQKPISKFATFKPRGFCFEGDQTNRKFNWNPRNFGSSEEPNNEESWRARIWGFEEESNNRKNWNHRRCSFEEQKCDKQGWKPRNCSFETTNSGEPQLHNSTRDEQQQENNHGRCNGRREEEGASGPRRSSGCGDGRWTWRRSRGGDGGANSDGSAGLTHGGYSLHAFGEHGIPHGGEHGFPRGGDHGISHGEEQGSGGEPRKGRRCFASRRNEGDFFSPQFRWQRGGNRTDGEVNRQNLDGQSPSHHLHHGFGMMMRGPHHGFGRSRGHWRRRTQQDFGAETNPQDPFNDFVF